MLNSAGYIILILISLLVIYFIRKSYERKFEDLKNKISIVLPNEAQFDEKPTKPIPDTIVNDNPSSAENEKLREKNEKIWKMSEAATREKHKYMELNEQLQKEKELLAEEKIKMEAKVKKLWATSTAVHKEKERINELKAKIEEKHKSIIDSIDYAKRIQESFLVPKSEMLNSFKEIALFYRPKDIVSGDFYWFSLVSDGESKKIIIAVTDCTGHGVPGALMSMIGNNGLNQVVNERGIAEVSLILENLDVYIKNALKQERTESGTNDGMDIAVCCIDKQKSLLTFAGANRPLWMIRNKNLTEYKPDKFPLGGFQYQQTEKKFTIHEMVVQPGDIFYLTTDGFADQFGGPGGRKLMTKEFKNQLLSIHHLKMDKQELYLQGYFENWKGVHEQVDDVLVMGWKC